jgi:hypothetical protein
MPRARLVELPRYRAEMRARRTISHLRRLAAQVRRHAADASGGEARRLRELHTLLSNGAWAVEDLYNLHPPKEV